MKYIDFLHCYKQIAAASVRYLLEGISKVIFAHFDFSVPKPIISWQLTTINFISFISAVINFLTYSEVLITTIDTNYFFEGLVISNSAFFLHFIANLDGFTVNIKKFESKGFA